MGEPSFNRISIETTIITGHNINKPKREQEISNDFLMLITLHSFYFFEIIKLAN